MPRQGNEIAEQITDESRGRLVLQIALGIEARGSVPDHHLRLVDDPGRWVALIVLIETRDVMKLEDLECRAFGNERDRRPQGGAVARGPPQAARDAQDSNRLISVIIVASAAKNLSSFALPARRFVAHLAGVQLTRNERGGPAISSSVTSASPKASRHVAQSKRDRTQLVVVRTPADRDAMTRLMPSEVRRSPASRLAAAGRLASRSRQGRVNHAPCFVGIRGDKPSCAVARHPGAFGTAIAPLEEVVVRAQNGSRS